MNSSQFSQALDSFDGKAIDAIPFICKSCNIGFDIASMLFNNNKNKHNCNNRIYKSLPVLSKKYLKEFNNFTLTVNIQFNYGT